MNNKFREIFLISGAVLVTIIFIIVLLLNTNMKTNQIVKDYNSLREDTIIRYTTADEVLSLMENEYSGIIVYGFKECPWCQAVIGYVDEIAKEKGYKEVLYLDIREMRDLEESEDHQKYLQIFEKIKDKIDNPLKIFAPTTTVMSKGEVVSYSIGTVDSHQKNDLNILPPMTDSQIEELKELFREMF